MVLLENYPFSSPVTTLMNGIFHPNIDEGGDICIDILDENWTPSLNLYSLVNSIRHLIKYPNPDDPNNDEAAEVYLENF